MRNSYIEQIEKNQIRTDLPTFKAGDNIQVHLKIKEGAKERIQVFEGLVIAKRHQGTSETFTVRKISYGIGVEKTFALNSPLIQKIKVVKVNKIRRAKLYYMRKLHGKATRLKELKK